MVSDVYAGAIELTYSLALSDVMISSASKSTVV